MKCKECGAEFEYKDDFCPFCGANIPLGGHSAGGSAESVVDNDYSAPVSPESLYSMKWYKFLVNFLLWLSAIVNVIAAYNYFTGASYQGIADRIYNDVKSLQSLDFFSGIAAIVFVVLAIATIISLKNYKKSGPVLLVIFYVLSSVFNLAYFLAVNNIVSEVGKTVIEGTFYKGNMMYEFTFDLSALASIENYIMPILSGVVMAIINIIYFNNRKELFIY